MHKALFFSHTLPSKAFGIERTTEVAEITWRCKDSSMNRVRPKCLIWQSSEFISQYTILSTPVKPNAIGIYPIFVFTQGCDQY